MGKTYVQGELLTALDLNNSLSELVNTTGTYVFTGAHTYNANLVANSGIWNPSQPTYTTAVTLTSKIFGTTVQLQGGPYTVVLPSPTQYNGAEFNIFLNNGGTSTITLNTPSGAFFGPAGNGSANLPLNQSISFFWTLVSDGVNWIAVSHVRIDVNGNIATPATLYAGGNITTGATNIDRIGELRTVVLTPASGSVAGKTLDATDHGKLVVTTAGITIPANIFTAGQNVSMHNFTDANITITAGSGLTLYKSGIGAAATATLAKRGIATVIFLTGAIAVITGAGLT